MSPLERIIDAAAFALGFALTCVAIALEDDDLNELEPQPGDKVLVSWHGEKPFHATVKRTDSSEIPYLLEFEVLQRVSATSWGKREHIVRVVERAEVAHG